MICISPVPECVFARTSIPTSSRRAFVWSERTRTMQQIERVRDRADETGKWFRVGLVSTTAIAPLLARWNDLRVTKRELRKREEAEARRPDARASAQSRVADLRARLARGRADGADGAERGLTAVPESTAPRRVSSDNVRLGLWLAGVGLGLVAAGAGAYFLARRRLAASVDEPLLELPTSKAPANGARPEKPNSKGRARHGTSQENRASAPTSPAQDESHYPGLSRSIGLSGSVETEMPEPERGHIFSPAPADAAFVGNVHTMIYHDAGDVQHLPADENRTYFASEEDARNRGYRRARSAMPPATESGVLPEGPSA
jgi:hypothetical protein